MLWTLYRRLIASLFFHAVFLLLFKESQQTVIFSIQRNGPTEGLPKKSQSKLFDSPSLPLVSSRHIPRAFIIPYLCEPATKESYQDDELHRIALHQRLLPHLQYLHRYARHCPLVFRRLLDHLLPGHEDLRLCHRGRHCHAPLLFLWNLRLRLNSWLLRRCDRSGTKDDRRFIVRLISTTCLDAGPRLCRCLKKLHDHENVRKNPIITARLGPKGLSNIYVNVQERESKRNKVYPCFLRKLISSPSSVPVTRQERRCFCKLSNILFLCRLTRSYEDLDLEPPRMSLARLVSSNSKAPSVWLWDRLRRNEVSTSQGEDPLEWTHFPRRLTKHRPAVFLVVHHLQGKSAGMFAVGVTRSELMASIDGIPRSKRMASIDGVQRSKLMGSTDRVSRSKLMGSTDRVSRSKLIASSSKAHTARRKKSKRSANSDGDPEDANEDEMLQEAFEDIDRLQDNRKMEHQLLQRLYGQTQGIEEPLTGEQAREFAVTDDHHKSGNHNKNYGKKNGKKHDELYQNGKLRDKLAFAYRDKLLVPEEDDDDYHVQRSLLEHSSKLREKKSKAGRLHSNSVSHHGKTSKSRGEKLGGKAKAVSHSKSVKENHKARAQKDDYYGMEIFSRGGRREIQQETRHQSSDDRPSHSRYDSLTEDIGSDVKPVAKLREYTPLPHAERTTRAMKKGRKLHKYMKSWKDRKIAGESPANDHPPITSDPEGAENNDMVVGTTTPVSSRLDTQVVASMAKEEEDSDRREGNATAEFDIVDKSPDRIDLNVTKEESWKVLLHGRRDLILAGCVMVAVGLLISGIAVTGILVRYSKKRKALNTNNSKPYRNLGSKEEKKNLKRMSLFPGSSEEESGGEDELFALTSPEVETYRQTYRQGQPLLYE